MLTYQMCDVMSEAFVLFVYNEMIDKAYFDEIFKVFLDAGVRKYIIESKFY